MYNTYTDLLVNSNNLLTLVFVKRVAGNKPHVWTITWMGTGSLPFLHTYPELQVGWRGRLVVSCSPRWASKFKRCTFIG
jgi:hypothetical protein